MHNAVLNFVGNSDSITVDFTCKGEGGYKIPSPSIFADDNNLWIYGEDDSYLHLLADNYTSEVTEEELVIKYENGTEILLTKTLECVNI